MRFDPVLSLLFGAVAVAVLFRRGAQGQPSALTQVFAKFLGRQPRPSVKAIDRTPNKRERLGLRRNLSSVRKVRATLQRPGEVTQGLST